MRKTTKSLITIVALLFGLSLAAFAQKPETPVDQLKAEADRASGGQQAKLYAELTQRLVEVASEQFAQNDSEKGHATVREILDYAAKARDIALSSHNKLKEVEIHLRQTQRHLESLKRTLAADERPPLDAAEKALADYRQQLLDELFAPKKKEEKK